MKDLALRNLKCLQKAWHINNRSVSEAMRSVVAFPFSDILCESSSWYGKMAHLFSAGTPAQKLSRVQEITQTALDLIDQQAIAVGAEHSKFYVQLLALRGFKRVNKQQKITSRNRQEVILFPLSNQFFALNSWKGRFAHWISFVPTYYKQERIKKITCKALEVLDQLALVKEARDSQLYEKTLEDQELFRDLTPIRNENFGKTLILSPFSNHLYDQDSWKGRWLQFFDCTSIEMRRERLQNMIRQAIQQIRECEWEVESQNNDECRKLLENRGFKPLRGFSEDLGFNITTAQIVSIAQRLITKDKAKEEKNLFSALAAILALGPKNNHYSAFILKNPLVIENKINPLRSINGLEDPKLYKSIFTTLDEKKYAALTACVREEKLFANELLEKPASSHDRNVLVDSRVHQLQLRLKELKDGESLFQLIKVGAHAFWIDLIWKYTQTHFSIDFSQVEQAVKEMSQSGRIPDVTQWLDTLFEKVIPEPITDSLDFAAPYLQMLYKTIQLPLFADHRRCLTTLKAVFPGMIADFLEKKYQGGAIEILAPLLPIWSVNANRNIVNFSDNISEFIEIDPIHSFTHVLREKTKQKLKNLVGENSSVLQEAFDELIHGSFQAQEIFENYRTGREDITHFLFDQYSTPFASLIEFIKKPIGYDLILYSRGSVEQYHPIDGSRKRCAKWFRNLTLDQLNSSRFLRRYFEWGYAYELGFDLTSTDDFFEFFEASLGSSQVAIGQPIDTRPGFDISQKFALELCGVKAKSSLQVMTDYSLDALYHFCSENVKVILDTTRPLPLELARELRKLIQFIRVHANYQSFDNSLIHSLDLLEKRTKSSTHFIEETFQNEIVTHRLAIVQSIRNHPLLMYLILGAEAEPISDLLMQRLNINPADIVMEGLQERSWWIKHQKIILEIFYSCFVVGTFYSALWLANIHQFTLTRAGYYIITYIASQVDWKNILPLAYKKRVDKVVRWYESARSWIFINSKVRNLVVMTSWKVIDVTHLDKLRQTLEVIEKYKILLRSFLNHGPGLRLTPVIQLNPIRAVFKLDVSKKLHSLDSCSSLLSLTLPQVLDSTNGYLNQIPPNEVALVQLKKIDKVKNEPETLAPLLDFFCTNLKLPIDSKIAKSLWDKVTNEQLVEIQSLIDQIVSSRDSPFRSYGNWQDDKNNDPIKLHLAVQDWHFMATCAVLQKYIAHRVVLKSKSFNIFNTNLLCDFHLDKSVQITHRQIISLTKSPLKYQRFVNIIAYLTGLESEKVSWNKIVKNIFCSGNLQPTSKALELFKSTKTSLQWIEDGNLPSLFPSLNYNLTKKLKSKIPSKFIGVDSKLIEVEALLIKFRTLIANEPDLYNQLDYSAKKFLENHKEGLKFEVDIEVLYIFLFYQSFNIHQAVSESLKLDISWIYWMRFSASQLIKLNQRLFENFNEDPKDKIKKLFISSNSSANTLLSKNQFLQKYDLIAELFLPSYKEAYESLVLSGKNKKLKLLNQALVEAKEFDVVATLTEKEILINSYQNKSPEFNQDFKQFRVNLQQSITTLCSFLLANPILPSQSPQVREILIKAFNPSAFDQAFKSKLIHEQTLRLTWQSLWNNAPYCPFYKKWLLSLGLLFQSHAAIHGHKLDLILMHHAKELLKECESSPLFLRLELLKDKLALSCHPHSLVNDQEIIENLYAFAQLRAHTRKRDLEDKANLEWMKERLEVCGFKLDHESQTLNIILPQTFLALREEAWNTCSWQTCLREVKNSTDINYLNNFLNGLVESSIEDSYEGNWQDHDQYCQNKENSLSLDSVESPINTFMYRTKEGWSYNWITGELANSHHHHKKQALIELIHSPLFCDLKLNEIKMWKNCDEGWQTTEDYQLGFYELRTLATHSDRQFELILIDKDQRLSFENTGLSEKLKAFLPSPFQKFNGHVFSNPDQTICIDAYERKACFVRRPSAQMNEFFGTAYILSGQDLYFRLENLPSNFGALKHLKDTNWYAKVKHKPQSQISFRELTFACDLDSIEQICHEELKLEFEIKGERLYECSKFKGYWIDQSFNVILQNLPWSSYVALRNEHNSWLFLTKSSPVPINAILHRLLPQLPLLSMISYWIMSEWGLEHLKAYQSSSEPYYIYSLRSASNLDSSSILKFNSESFNALIELFTNYCLSGSFKEAEETLAMIENWQSTRLSDRPLSLNLAFIAAQHFEPEMALLRIRFLASLSKQVQLSTKIEPRAESDHLVQLDKKANEETDLGFLLLVASTGYDYLKFLQYPEEKLKNFFSERDELLILNAIYQALEMVYSQLIKQNLPQKIFKSELIRSAIVAVAQTMILPVKIQQRVKYLSSWSERQNSDDLTGLILLKKRLKRVEDYATTLTQELSKSSFFSLINSPFVALAPSDSPNFLALGARALLNQKNSFESNVKNDEKIAYLLSIPPENELEPEDLLDRESLNHHFLKYYHIALHESNERSFQVKQMLKQCIGGWDERSRFQIKMLKAALEKVQGLPSAKDLQQTLRIAKRINRSTNLVESEKSQLMIIHKDLSKLIETVEEYVRLQISYYNSDSMQVLKRISSLFQTTNVNTQIYSRLPSQNLFRQVSYVIPPQVLSWLFKGIHLSYRSYRILNNRKKVDIITYKKSSHSPCSHKISRLLQEARHLDNAIDERLKILQTLLFPNIEKLSLNFDFKFLKQEGEDSSHSLVYEEIKKIEEGGKQVQDVWNKETNKKFDAPGDYWQIALALSDIYSQLKVALDNSSLALKDLIDEDTRHTLGANWFNRLIYAYAQDQLHSFSADLHLEEIEILELHLTNHLIAVSRFARIEQTLELLKQLTAANFIEEEPLLKRFHALISQRREWNFESIDHDMMRMALVFEAQNKTLLTFSQFNRMHNAFNTIKVKNAVLIEAIMGSGKTFFGIPATIQILKNNHLVWQIFTPQLIESSGLLVAQQSYQAYGVHTQRLNIQRSQHEESFWLNLLQTLRSSFEAQEPILSTPTDPQSLLLCWLTGLHEAQQGKAIYSDQSLIAMAEALRLIKAKGVVLVDEAHEVYSPKRETRFPIGDRLHLDKDLIENMVEFFLIVHKTTLSADLINGSAFGIEAAKLKAYQETIADEIANQMVKDKKFSENQRVYIKNFLTDLSLGSELIDFSSLLSKLCLFRGLLNIYLPSALSGALMVHYGPEPSKPYAPAMPYQSAGMPLKGSVIKSPLESLAKTFIMHFSLGLDDKIAFEELINLARECLGSTDEELTPSRKKLIDRLKGDKEKTKVFQQALNSDLYVALKPLAQELRSDPEFIASFISRQVASQVMIWQESMSCNAQLFSSLFAKQIADTGTANIVEIYPVEMEIQRDLSATAEAMIILQAKTRRVDKLISNEPCEILDIIAQSYCSIASSHRPHALIDGGALLRGIASEKIAERIGKVLKDKIDYVFYYQANDLKAWDIARETSLDANAIYVDPNRRFTFYDHSHSCGTDIEQAKQAHAIVLVGTDLDLQILQHAFRMRNLKEGASYEKPKSLEIGQSLSFLLSANVAARFSNEDLNHPITIQQLLAAALKGNVNLADELNVQTFVQKIKAVVPARCIEILLERKDLAEQKRLVKKYQRVFCEKQELDPIILFEKSTQMIKSDEALNQLIKNQQQIASDLDLDGLEEDFDKICKKYRAAHLPDQIKSSINKNLDGTGLATHLALELEDQVKQQKQIQVQSLNQIGFIPKGWSFHASIHEINWIERLSGEASRKSSWSLWSPTKLDSIQGPRLHSLSKWFENQPKEEFFSQLIDSRLLVTNNIWPLEDYGLEGPASLRNKLVRSCRTILVYQSKKEVKKICYAIALATSEIEPWRQVIKNNSARGSQYEAFLCDIHTGDRYCYSGDSKDFLTKSQEKELNELIAQVRVVWGYGNQSNQLDEIYKQGLESWLMRKSTLPLNERHDRWSKMNQLICLGNNKNPATSVTTVLSYMNELKSLI